MAKNSFHLYQPAYKWMDGCHITIAECGDGDITEVQHFSYLDQTILKGRWEPLVESIVLRVPIVKTIYDAAKRVVQIADSGDGTNMKSMTPVICQFGGEGGTCFPAFLSTSETVLVQGEEFHVIMIPTAPAPLGGAIMCVPKAWITELDCGIDGLLNVYMSMGTTAPDHV